MPNAYFGYINRPFADISGVIRNWADISQKLLVYQHDPDDGCTHIHCHILALDVQLDTKQLYKRKDFRSLGLDGTKKEFGFNIFRPQLSTVEYMTKGIFDPVFNKGFEQDELDAAKRLGYIKPSKLANVNANVNQKKKSAKDTHFDVCMRVRDMSLTKSALMRNADGEIINAKVFVSFDNVYKNLLTVLDELKIRTSEYDMDRWLFTILRNDPYSDGIRDKFREKYKSKFYDSIADA